MKRLICVFLVLILVFSFPVHVEGDSEKDAAIAILFTNDIHCYYDQNIGYDGLALYKKELLQQYEHVILVDAGDAIQGAPIGAVSKGEEIIRMMNEVGYDIAILGNHEFDYGFEVLDDLQEQLHCSYVSTNFCTSDGEPVYDSYRILECGDTKVAFISAVTPETFSKSSIHELIDDLGVPMYDFKSDETGELLYSCLQSAVDEVREQGADFVIMVSHLGNAQEDIDAYRSIEVVSHLCGLDAVIDAHSHQVYNIVTTDAEGKEIPLAQTGSCFANVGTMILHPDGTIEVDLLDEIPAPEDWMDEIEIVTVSRGNKDRYVDAGMNRYLEEITDSYTEIMNRRIGRVSYDMIVWDEAKDITSRNKENGLCDLVADAFRDAGETDIGLICASSVRSNLMAGEISFNMILNTLPYSNDILIAEVDGETFLDALEFGCRSMPVVSGGFPQISGVEFTVDMGTESTVETTEKGEFVKVVGERRVRDVLIDGEPLDPDMVYTIATTEYTLKGGDGYSMFTEGAVITGTTNLTDNILVSKYIEQNLNGVIPDTYQHTGDRIHIK